jgi:formylglycine-generating enzyme required for sulfatase activity
MSKYPITIEQWAAVSELPAISYDVEKYPSYSKYSKRPVTNISFDDAIEFCTRICVALKKQYRLPSSAVWEYACRAGTNTAFSFGDNLTNHLANHGNPEKKELQINSVGCFYPNSFGLYDMHGLVWEWCSNLWWELDDYNFFRMASSIDRKVVFNYDNLDPLRAESSWRQEKYIDPRWRWISIGLLRGGSFKAPAYECRSAKERIFLVKGRYTNFDKVNRVFNAEKKDIHDKHLDLFDCGFRIIKSLEHDEYKKIDNNLFVHQYKVGAEKAVFMDKIYYQHKMQFNRESRRIVKRSKFEDFED